jgi:hypothetical protein
VRKRRPIGIPDYRAGRYFGRLEQFLGTEGIQRRLERVEREIRSQRGIYLQHWVLPKNAWWLGLKEARDLMSGGGSFRRALTPLMEKPLQTAVKLSMLHTSTPSWKKDELRSRILSDDILQPALFEIDTAAHFHHLGCGIRWLESGTESGKRTPEFVAALGGSELEVECKAKQADSGRRMERAALYRAVDRFIPPMERRSLCGTLFLTIPGRLPVDHAWQDEVVQALENHVQLGTGLHRLPDGSLLEYDLQKPEGTKIPLRVLAESIDMKSHPYAHFAVTGERHGRLIANPLIFRLESQKADRFLQNVLTSLRDAESQFSGTRAGVICCRIPEIDSFEGLQADSAIQQMTYTFFETYASDCIYAVNYVAEAKREVEGRVILSDMPALMFRSSRYNIRFGDDFQLY